jgi:hypothetical protein
MELILIGDQQVIDGAGLSVSQRRYRLRRRAKSHLGAELAFGKHRAHRKVRSRVHRWIFCYFIQGLNSNNVLNTNVERQ